MTAPHPDPSASGPVLPEWPDQPSPPPPPTTARVDANPWGHPLPTIVPITRRWWRDWRSWVGGTGRVLIATGLLMFAFVAYQLWGTGIEQARSQDQLTSRFRVLQAQARTGVPTTTATTATTAASTTVPPPDTTATTVATTVATTAATTVPTTAAPVALQPVQPITFKPGDPIAVLRIPAIGVEQTVVSGVGRSDLQKGPGHFRTTPLPGQAGNAAIAGHRTTYGEPFRRLDELKPGDRIEITDVFERRYVYRVEDRIIVRPDDVAVLDDRGKPELTLVTCDPPFTADRRLVVRALLDESSSATPTPATTLAPPSDRASELDPPGATVPPEVTSTTAAGATSSTPATTAPAQSVSPLTADEVQGQLDGFQQTWFSDAKAWPHVAAWGAALTLVALAAWRVSRRVRRNWVGALVGIAPFVVVLYFFFQNVNRLLPAGF